MNTSSLVWKYEIVSELCSGNDFGTDGRNDGMTPKPISPFHFVAGDNNYTLVPESLAGSRSLASMECASK